ncbi:hypothetical protein DY000_02050886 [Brassica cretica]|uniref:Uncharacterized protein n=1 Tax=Brassica cretica TaxID=69181 RepID=A0ABQ7EQ14_BRACR|nr:hypothetical protein DY000_02050886 [Brassica cretica]
MNEDFDGVSRRRRGGGGQVEAVTTRDALMEQISPRVELASSTRYPIGRAASEFGPRAHLAFSFNP